MTSLEPRAAESSLNESQQRRLAVTCRYVDRLLSDVERILTQSASGSPFAPYVDDLSPAQRGAIADYLRAIRDELLRVLTRHGLSPGGQPLSAAHSLRTHLTFVGVAIEELKPKYMRGYGDVSAEAVTELQGLTEQLQSIVQRLDDLVARAGLADLQARLERLERAGADTRVLDALAAIVDARGLVEFRPALGIVLDRLEDLRFELAVFGRSRHDAEPHVVVALVHALERFDDPRAREAIEGALGHASFMVRSEATLALARMGGGRARGPEMTQHPRVACQDRSGVRSTRDRGN